MSNSWTDGTKNILAKNKYIILLNIYKKRSDIQRCRVGAGQVRVQFAQVEQRGLARLCFRKGLETDQRAARGLWLCIQQICGFLQARLQKRLAQGLGVRICMRGQRGASIQKCQQGAGGVLDQLLI